MNHCVYGLPYPTEVQGPTRTTVDRTVAGGGVGGARDLGAAGQCAVHVDCIVSCSGAYADTGTSERLHAPAPVPGLTGIDGLALASVRRHYAVHTDGRMLCWGQHVNFSRGDGRTATAASPRPLVVR